MSHTLSNPSIVQRFGPAGLRLRRHIERQPALRLAILLAANALPLVVLWLPLLAATAGGVILLNLWEPRTPAEWLGLELAGVMTVTGGWLGFRLRRAIPPAPDGVLIDSATAPLLFDMLIRRSQHFGLAVPEQVLLTDRPELSFLRRPAAALPGGGYWQLRIGAPLLFFMSRDRFRLALAGLFAAEASSRRGPSGWVLRRRDEWPETIQALERQGGVAARLYLPLIRTVAALNASLAPELAREQELAALRWVAGKTDETQMIQLLATRAMVASYLKQHYWPMILRGADRCPEPVVKPFSHFGLLLERMLTPAMSQRWLLAAQTCEQDNGELRELMAGLGIEHLHWNGLPAESAAHVLLDEKLLRQLDLHWQNRIQPHWNERHLRFQQSRNRFRVLLKRHREEAPLRARAALRLVRLAERFTRPAEFGDICRSVADANRTDAGVQFACGERLLKIGATTDGLQALKRAAALDERLKPRAESLARSRRTAWLEEVPTGSGVREAV